MFDDDRYYTLYNRVYDSPLEAKGRKIVLRGFVDRPSGTTTANVVLIARNMMWCCSADMAEIGFLRAGRESPNSRNRNGSKRGAL